MTQDAVGGERMIKRFQVGKPHDFSSEDPWFQDEREAIEYAAGWHREDHSEPVGIWDDRNQWLWLFYDGEQFRRV